MRRYRWFVVPALGVVLAILGLLVFALKDALVYFRTPTEVAESVAEGRVRLGGQVVPGTIEESPGGVAFDVTDGTTTLTVAHTGAPQQLFRAGIGVVVEGTWDGAVFHSDHMMVKHDEQYRTEDGGTYHPGGYPTGDPG
jgi:cytochrome c-type biogenesis protein CcmE